MRGSLSCPMVTLLLGRHDALSADEIRNLPTGALLTDGDGGIRVRATLDLPLAALLDFAYALGEAVAGGVLYVEEPKLEAPAPRPPPRDDLDVITEHDPWKLVDAGDPARAERVFAQGNGLDAAGRQRVQGMWAAADPDTVSLACRIARLTGWKSAVQTLRRLLTHPHPDVRRDAAAAIGDLAGPSLAVALRSLSADPDAEVRSVAGEALAKLGG